MKTKLLFVVAGLLTGCSFAFAQTTIVVGGNGDAGYRWIDLAPSTGTQVETTSAYLFPAPTDPYHFTFNVAVNEPGALSGSFAVTLYGTNLSGSVAYRLTQYLQNSLNLLAIDQPGVTGNEARAIAQTEKLSLSIDTSNLTSLNGGLVKVTLTNFSTYGLSDTESLSATRNGSAAATFMGTSTSVGYDTTGAVTHALGYQLSSGDIVAWTPVNTLQYRMGDLTFVAESVATAIPEPSTYAAIMGLGALSTLIWSRRRNRAA